MKATWTMLTVLLLAALTPTMGCDDEGTTCAAPTTDCSGTCVNTATDGNNCGLCGRVCGSTESCCGGSCIDLSSDVSNCGFCGNTCSIGQSCNGGSCGSTAQEACNNTDDDGDGQIDEGLTRTCSTCLGSGNETCVAGIWQSCTAPAPANDETICDGEDDDCNGEVDEGVTLTFYRDADGDTFGDPHTMVEECEAPAGYVEDDTDCDDTNDEIHPVTPDAEETICDGADDDCDGTPDDGCTCSPGEDQACGVEAQLASVGLCRPGSQSCADVGSGPEWGDCEGGVAPVAESCDGEDNDCDGDVDEGLTPDTGEANNDCDAARGPFVADEDGEEISVTGTLYSPDGAQDEDWFIIDTVESWLDWCPWGAECNFKLDVALRLPEGAAADEWEMCLEYHEDEECGGALEDTICTEAADYDEASGQFAFTVTWPGSCLFEDGRNFHVVVRNAGDAAVNNCQPYEASFLFYYLEEECTEE